MSSAAYSVREHRKTEVDAEIRRSSQVEESVDGSWGHPCESKTSLRTLKKCNSPNKQYLAKGKIRLKPTNLKS